MNNIVKILNVKEGTNLDTISKAFVELKSLEQKFLDKNDYVNIKGKIYIKKSGYRKLSLILGISTEIVKHDRIEKDKYFIHEYTIRAIASNGRYTECSASCASNERVYNHIENDTISTAQTRASSRAIGDLLGIGEIFYDDTKGNNSTGKNNTNIKSYNKNNTNTESYNNNNQNTNNITTTTSYITNKQKDYLTKLINDNLEEEEKQNYLNNINELTITEASNLIKQLS